MDNKNITKGANTPSKEEQKAPIEDKQTRLSGALRKNLQRRKAQAKKK